MRMRTYVVLCQEVLRLPLLCQVAGTKVYEDRRAESFKILKQTDLRREKINDVIKNIEAKLSTLEEEKADLQQYLTFDKKERAVKYCIYTLANEQALNAVRSSHKQLSHFTFHFADGSFSSSGSG